MKILKDLHTGRKKFSRVERMHFLQELEEELKVYYLSYTETVDRPYSEHIPIYPSFFMRRNRKMKLVCACLMIPVTFSMATFMGRQ